MDMLVLQCTQRLSSGQMLVHLAAGYYVLFMWFRNLSVLTCQGLKGIYSGNVCRSKGVAVTLGVMSLYHSRSGYIVQKVSFL